MNDEIELLRHYVDQRSQAAFTQLVQRHIAVVHSIALRRVGGDAHLAEDVTQKVFADLARKAPDLIKRSALSGWLYAATHHASAATVRSERRRKARDFEAHLMQITLSLNEPAADWAQLRPVIDDAIVALNDEDREAVVKRFFEQRSFTEIGQALLVSEEAARKRVDRALDKLHALLVRRGVTSTAAALGLALTGAAANAVPAGVTDRVARVAFAQATTAGAVTAGVSLMKSLYPIASALSVGAAVFLIGREELRQHALRTEIARLREQHQENGALRAQNRDLSRELASSLELRRAQSELPELRATLAALLGAPSPTRGTIILSAEGTLRWDNRPINLDEFLARLKALQTKDPAANVMIVAAENAKAVQLGYVVAEVRKAKLQASTIRADMSLPLSSF